MTAELNANTHSSPPLIGLAALMRMVFEEKDLKPLAAELTARAERDPLDANALLDLSTILQLNFQHQLAMHLQDEAINTQRVYSLPSRQQPAKLRLLALLGAGDLLSNTPVECLLENSDIDLDILYVSPTLPIPQTVPDHDVLFVAIGECAENLPILQDLNKLGEFWPRPVINSPEHIARLSRDNTCALLGDISGVLMPISKRLNKQHVNNIPEQQQILEHVLPGTTYPIIIRPLDSHAGRGLAKIEQSQALENYLQTMPENEFYVSPFVDYRSADGLFRKYRIILIDGVPYICHLAISSHWMIHYLNAGMADSAEKRAEEAQCFAQFDTRFAARHAQAFAQIAQRLKLDYLGIDCAETSDGKLLIFEVDSNMIVHDFDPADKYPYKKPQMQKIFSAFRELLKKKAHRDPSERA
ncbi:MAG: RimK family alpha-L-glutamate ligase [Gallionellaceae bacterium]|jgi:glutathione synthase/RimK-type ligase-like ATP-grasp enzyme